jgi:hypothetical protein
MTVAIPIFPALPLSFPVRITPMFKSLVGVAKPSSRETRFSQRSSPLWEMELLFEELRTQTQNAVPYAPFSGFKEYDDLVQLFLVTYGTAGLFYFSAPWDNSRLGLVVGVGTGSITSFPVFRVWGVGFAERVGGVASVSQIYFNGVPQGTGGVSISGNQLVFSSAPGGGVNITADLAFYYACKFTTESIDLEEFSLNRWTTKNLTIRSTIIQ